MWRGHCKQFILVDGVAQDIFYPVELISNGTATC